MKISTIHTGFFKLDGGAMFGVVPKQLWQRMNPPDEKNMCTWSMRCLLIEIADRKILVDTGIGDKQDEKFRAHFEPHGTMTLENSLQNKGLQFKDITDVFLTHLHFDHVGGAVKKDAQGNLSPAFPNATYWSNKAHYDWAFTPNERERASFLRENFVPLQEAGVLQFIDVQTDDVAWLPGIRIRFVYGHTEAMMVLFLESEGQTLVYCTDVIASSHHIGMPYVMSYDVRPLETLKEKERILQDALANNHVLIFEHDPEIACATVKQNERGRIVLDKTYATIESAMIDL